LSNGDSRRRISVCALWRNNNITHATSIASNVANAARVTAAGSGMAYTRGGVNFSGHGGILASTALAAR